MSSSHVERHLNIKVHGVNIYVSTSLCLSSSSRGVFIIVPCHCACAPRQRWSTISGVGHDVTGHVVSLCGRLREAGIRADCREGQRRRKISVRMSGMRMLLVVDLQGGSVKNTSHRIIPDQQCDSRKDWLWLYGDYIYRVQAISVFSWNTLNISCCIYLHWKYR